MSEWLLLHAQAFQPAACGTAAGQYHKYTHVRNHCMHTVSVHAAAYYDKVLRRQRRAVLGGVWFHVVTHFTV